MRRSRGWPGLVRPLAATNAAQLAHALFAIAIGRVSACERACVRAAVYGTYNLISEFCVVLRRRRWCCCWRNCWHPIAVMPNIVRDYALIQSIRSYDI